MGSFWSRPRTAGARSAPLALGALLGLASSAQARPNTHAPAISSWDTRASSIVFALGRAVSGEGRFTRASYNANFSSTSGILSAQFGVHYLAYQGSDADPVARGFSAGGVALLSFPLAERYANGVAPTSFAFYLGGVPTALFSGQLNFISVPLVIGLGLPYSPAPALTLTPWFELSPGLNFDTSIEEVSTEDAIAAARDGTLTRAEVEDLVEQGLDISRDTSLGTRAGASVSVHLGKRVDLDLNFVIGAGNSGAAALSGALVVRWDAMVPGVVGSGDGPRPSCAEVESRLRRCAKRLEQLRRRPRRGPRRAAPPQPTRTSPAAAPTPAAPAPQVAPAPVSPPRPGELPPLQAAPPRPK